MERKKRKASPPVYFGTRGVDPTANNEIRDIEEGGNDIDPNDLLIEPRILLNDPLYKIDPSDRKFPLTIVWEPYNWLSMILMPWMGIVGVGDIGG